MAKFKKQEETPIEKPKESVPEPVPVPIAAKSELEVMLEQQAALLALRGQMIGFGIDSISKLDAVLSQVNQRVKVLS